MTLQQWLFVCFASVFFAKVNPVYYENKATSELGKKYAKKASRLLWMPSVLERHRQLKFCGNNEYEKSEQVFQFSWKNCGNASDPLQVNTLRVSPDPIRLPGNVSIGFLAKLAADVNTAVQVKVNLQKKVVIWITVPCIENIGSCTYDNVCDMTSLFPCPQEFPKYKIPCQCPVQQNTYNLPSASIPINHYVPSGDYRLTIHMNMDGQPLGCIYTEFSVN